MALSNVMSWISNPLGSLLGDGASGTIWNHGSDYQVPSAGESANAFSGSGMDPNGFVAGLWNDITGVTAQSREFAQQEYLQDKMNEYNHPVNEMMRQKDAGINPNLTAQGISQAGSQSAQVPAVSSNVGGAAQGLSAVGSAVGGVAGGVAGLALTAAQKRNLDASSDEMIANARRTNALLDFEKRSMIAETTKTLVDAKLDKYQAKYWSVQAMYASPEKMLDMFGKFFQVKEATHRIRLLRDEHKMNKERLDILKQQVSQEEYRTEIMRIDSVLKQGIEKVYNELGIDITLPEIGMAIQASESGSLDTIMDVFEKLEYHKSKGSLNAKVDTAFDEAFNTALGSSEVAAMYAPYLAKIEAQKQNLIDCFKMYLENPSDIKGFATKMVNIFVNGINAMYLDSTDVQKSKVPVAVPRYHHRSSAAQSNTSFRW